MTCLEKLRAEYPNLPDSAINAILEETCPEEFGYLEEPERCDTQTTCKACWNREIPEEVTIYHKEPLTEDDVIAPADVDVFTMFANAQADMEKDMDEVITARLDPDKWKSRNQDTPRILDSGNRRQFESGAVRDIQEGKGRCDLLPLDVVGDILHNAVFNFIDSFQKTGDSSFLMNALLSCGIFSEHEDSNSCYLHNMLLEVAIHFEEGAKKYGDNNWRKGIPVRCYVDSGVRHYLKFLRGDRDEPHDRAFCWNIMCAIWTCKHKPELNEYGDKLEEEE